MAPATADVLARYSRVLPLEIVTHRKREGYARSMDELLRLALQRTDRPKRDCAITLHADFVHNPEAMEEMVKRLESGADLVVAEEPDGNGLPRAHRWARRFAPRLLRVAGVEDLLRSATSGSDADHSKPDPDIVAAALRRVGCGPQATVLIGDTPYDVEAGARAGVAVIAFRSGGWSDAPLQGALALYDGAADLLDSIHLCGTLDEALHAATLTIGFSARARDLPETKSGPDWLLALDCKLATRMRAYERSLER